MAREFEPVFLPEDLVNLPNHSVYVKLMIDSTPSRPFSLKFLVRVVTMAQLSCCHF